MPVNPYITSRVERYRTLRAEIDGMQTRAVNENRDLTDAELSMVKGHAEEAKTIYAEIVPEIEEHTRAEKVAELAAKIHQAHRDQANGTPAGPGDQVPPLMPSRAQLDQVRSMMTGESPHPVRFTTVQARQAGEHNRAVVTMATDAGQPVQAMGPRPLPEPRRIATAAVLPVERVEGTTGVTFPVFGSGTAGVAAENAAKTEYDNIAPGTATPQVVNAFTDFTRQLALSHGAFEQRLRSKLARLVAAREDVLLQAKVMATAGIQTQAFVAGNQASQVLIGAAKVENAVGVAPDVALVNPADVGLLLGAGLANTPPAELAQLDLQLWGMRLYVTSAQTAGFVLAGAWRASSRLVVGMDPTYLLDPYTGLKTNRITTLLEEAVDLAVEEPEGFISIDIITP